MDKEQTDSVDEIEGEKVRRARLRSAFRCALSRCNDPNVWNYKYYGFRGIQFKFESPEELEACIGLPPTTKHQIDRIDTDGHYEPGNVRWSTARENVRNRRPFSNSRRLTKDEVLKIMFYLGFGVTQQRIAELFGVTAIAISHIATGKSWSHLTGTKYCARVSSQ